MKAAVEAINANRGMYGAKIYVRNEYVIFELLDSCDIEVDDVVSHPDFYNIGGEVCKILLKAIH